MSKHANTAFISLPLSEAHADLECFLFHQAVATRLRLTVNEHRCIIFLMHSPHTPGELADMMGVTSGALTNLIDRLEKSGLVARVPDTTDRRRIQVQVSAACRKSVDKLFASLSQAHATLLASYTKTEQTAIQDFIVRSADITYQEAQKIKRSDQG